ncbi:MAG: hypothetical protein ACOYO2_07315 [Mycobacterium sp.]
MKKLAVTMLAVAAMSMGSLVAGPTAGADVRDPFDPYGVGGYGGIGSPLGPVAGPVGPVGVGGVGPVLGPVGPVGVGGVLGPVGVDPIVDAAVVDTAVHYDIPYGYPLGPAFPGELPCFTPSGEAYYTPGAEPCLCFAPTGGVIPC